MINLKKDREYYTLGGRYIGYVYVDQLSYAYVGDSSQYINTHTKYNITKNEMLHLGLWEIIKRYRVTYD